MKSKGFTYTLVFLIFGNFCPTNTKLTYPLVKQEDSVFDVYFDKKVPNPYKWITTAGEKEKVAFMEEQTKLTNSYLQKIAAADRKSIEKYIKMYEHEAFPHFVPTVKTGDKYFFFEIHEGKVYLQKSLKHKPNVILADPINRSVQSDKKLVSALPSPTGDTLAYAYNGSTFGQNLLITYHFQNTVTLKTLPDVLNNVVSLLFSGEVIEWSIDGSGIFYMSNSSTPAVVNAKPTAIQNMQVFYHSMGTKQTDDFFVAQLPTNSISQLKLTNDGQYLVAVHEPPRTMGVVATKPGIIYFMELCAKGKAPCQPTKYTKQTVTKISIYAPIIWYIGNKDNILYVLLSNVAGVFDSIVEVDLSTPNATNFKTVLKTTRVAEGISFAAIVKSEYLLVVYSNLMTNISRMAVHKLSSISKETNVQISHGHVIGISTGKKDANFIFHMKSILSVHEAYTGDVTKPGANPKKISLPGSMNDPFRDTIVTIPSDYRLPGGGFSPMIIMHPQNGKARTLMVLGSTNLTIKKLFIPFMKTFQGVVAISSIQLPPNQSTPCPPSKVSIQSAHAAINFLFQLKYTAKTLLTLIPGNNGYSGLLGALLNQYPDYFGAAILVDAASQKYANQSANTINSNRNLDLSPYFKDKKSTEILVGVSPIHNIRVPTNRKIQYPAVLLIDAGTDDMRYISKLQHQIGLIPQQVKPLLAKFPLHKISSTRTLVEMEIEQHADIFAFLVLSMEYKVTK